MKCIICKENTVTAYALDMESKAFPFCEDHEEEVSTASSILSLQGEKACRKYLREAKKKLLNQ